MIRSPQTAPHRRPDDATPAVLARRALPHTEVVVRWLHEADLRGLEWQGGADLRDFYRDLWDKHRRRAISALIADFNDFPIGLAVLYWRGKTAHPHVPDLQSLRVMPAFRGLGIGSLLLDTAEEQARAAGHTHISLSVSVENTRARQLYERLGYSVTSQPHLSLWNYRNAAGKIVRVEETVLDMIKELQGAN